MVKPAPFQSTITSGEVARIEPNKKWFGKFGCIYIHLCSMYRTYIEKKSDFVSLHSLELFLSELPEILGGGGGGKLNPWAPCPLNGLLQY